MKKIPKLIVVGLVVAVAAACSRQAENRPQSGYDYDNPYRYYAGPSIPPQDEIDANRPTPAPPRAPAGP